jgi:hypothetical protein
VRVEGGREERGKLGIRVRQRRRGLLTSSEERGMAGAWRIAGAVASAGDSEGEQVGGERKLGWTGPSTVATGRGVHRRYFPLFLF